jgi:SAM-dependent methyltransferase
MLAQRLRAAAWGPLARKIIRKLAGQRCLSTVHSSAEKGFTAEGAQLYELGRPTYTDEAMGTMIDAVFANPLKREKATLLELGSGTGKFTKSFLHYVAQEDAQKRWPLLRNMRYIASEPSEGFRDVLAQAVASGGDRDGDGDRDIADVSVVSALGSAIPVESGSLDGVFAAQAFHWMASEETLVELHRAVRPGGALVCIWNSYDYSYEWLRQIDQQV